MKKNRYYLPDYSDLLGASGHCPVVVNANGSYHVCENITYGGST